MSPIRLEVLLRIRTRQMSGPVRAALRGWAQRPRARRRGRLVLALAVLGALQVAVAGIAWAADETAVVNPWLSAFDVKDAAGIATGAYQLSLGGAGGMSMSAMGDAVARLLAQLAWFAYLLLATLGLWIFNWALQLKILDALDPVVAVVDSVLGSVIGRIGIVAALIALAWLLAVLYMVRGKTVAALMSFLVSLMMAAFVVSPAIDLPGTMVGPNGAAASSRDFGLQVVAEITSAGGAASTGSQPVTGTPAAGSDESAQAAAVRAATTSKLATALIRKAHQLVNYGSVIDGTKCEQVYTDVLKANAGADEARTKLGECDAKYAAAADNPMFALFGTVFLIPGGLLVASICVIFAGVLSVLVGMALWESAMFLLEALKGILPGESRTSMAVKLAIIGACLVFVVLVLMGVGVFVLVIDAILVQSSNPIIAFVVIDLILLVAVIALIAAMISARRSGRRLGERMGRSMSPDPHAGVSGGRAVPMQQAAAIAGQHIATRRALSKGLGGQQTGDVSAGAAEGESKERSGLAKVGGAAVGTVKAAGAVTKFGLASTIGAPVYVPRAYGAAKKVMAAKKVAMTGRLDQAKAKAGKKRNDAVAFGREYAHNLGVAARVTGVTKAARYAAHKSRPAVLAGAMWMGGPDEKAATAGRGTVHTSGRISPQELPERSRPTPSSGTGSGTSSRAGASPSSASGVRTSPAAAGSSSPTHVDANRRIGDAEAHAVATQEYRQQVLDSMRARGHGRRPAPARVGAST